MTKTVLNPKVSRVSEPKAVSAKHKKDKAQKTRESSTFKSLGKNKWSSMTKAMETPSIIGEGLDAIEQAQPKSRRDQTNSFIGNFMLGDQGNVRQSDGKNVLFADHETIDIPSARDLFRDYSTLQNNTLPVLQRYVGLRGTINNLIEVTTDSINSLGVSAQEKQGNIDYLDYLYDRLHTVQDEIDVIEYVRLNELHRRAVDQDDVDQVTENMDVEDNAFVDSSW